MKTISSSYTEQLHVCPYSVREYGPENLIQGMFLVF